MDMDMSVGMTPGLDELVGSMQDGFQDLFDKAQEAGMQEVAFYWLGAMRALITLRANLGPPVGSEERGL
jgi:hypothetical protein